MKLIYGIILGYFSITSSYSANIPASGQSVKHYAMAVCKVARASEGFMLQPSYDGDYFLANYLSRDARYSHFSFLGNGSTVSVEKSPQFGEISINKTETLDISYRYIPKSDVINTRDQVTFLLEKQGIRIMLHYLITVRDEDEPTSYIGDDHERHMHEDTQCTPAYRKLPATYSGNSRETKLRNNGVYVSCGLEDSYCYYLRFYENGAVISVTTEPPTESVLNSIKRWFVLEKAGLKHQGISLGKTNQKNEKISFSATSSSGVVDYEGSVSGVQLILNSHSHINGHREKRIYEFNSW